MIIRRNLKIIALLLLVVMANLVIHGMHEDAHAASCETPVATACDAPGAPAGGAHGDAVPSPFGPHQDADGCDSCLNCACHAPLSVMPLQIGYSPLVSFVHVPEPFAALPEVYLAKFVPPQNLS